MGNDVELWEMTQLFDKRLKNVAQVFEKRLNYVGNDLDLWEMAQICWEMT